MVTDTILAQAYQVLNNQKSGPEMENWQAAADILEHWDVPKLGEELAREVIFQIVLDTQFPDRDGNMETTKKFVHDAEHKGIELFPEIGDRDPSHDLYAVLRQKYLDEKNKEKLNEIKIK